MSNLDAESGLTGPQGFTDLQLAELSADPDAILGLLDRLKDATAEVERLRHDNEVLKEVVLRAADYIVSPNEGAQGTAQAWREAAGVYE